MMDHKICFYWEIYIIIPKLFLLPLRILYTDFRRPYPGWEWPYIPLFRVRGWCMDVLPKQKILVSCLVSWLIGLGLTALWDSISAHIEQPAAAPGRKKRCMVNSVYPETTNATDNSKRSCNKQAGIGCRFLSENILQWIKLIRGKCFLH